MKALILVRYHFLSLWNWRSSYLGRFIEPVAYMLFLVAGLRSAFTASDISYPLFALTGLGALLSFRCATNGMSDVANDRKWGVYAIFTMQNGTNLGYAVSLLIFNWSIFLLQFLLLWVCAGFVFGFPAMTSLAALYAAGVGMLVVAGWVGFGAAIGARVQSYAMRDLIVTLTTLPVVLAAPLFYPITEANGMLYYVSRANPLTYQVAWLREPSLMHALFAAAWTILGIVVALVFLKSADKVSSER